MSPTIITIILVVSSLLTILGVVPYIIEIIKGKTKPRIVSWLVWATLTGIAAAATWSSGDYPTAVLLTASTIATFSVVLLGLHHGDRRFARLDVICLLGAIVGLVLWQLFDSPEIAVVVMVLIDLVGGIPTLIHCWQKPHEETFITFFISFIGSLLVLIVTTDWTITAVLYPLFLVGINLTMSSIIFFRSRLQ